MLLEVLYDQSDPRGQPGHGQHRDAVPADAGGTGGRHRHPGAPAGGEFRPAQVRSIRRVLRESANPGVGPLLAVGELRRGVRPPFRQSSEALSPLQASNIDLTLGILLPF